VRSPPRAAGPSRVAARRGVGITPLRALFETLPGGPGEVTLVYRAGSPHELVFRDELEWFARDRGARVHYLLGPRGRGPRPDPLTAATLARLVPGLPSHDVYVCGPPGMTHEARRALRQAGVPRRQIHHESFTF
jgi:ferredoxin-NADP reductase